MKPSRELDALVAEKVMGLAPENFNRSVGPIELIDKGPALKHYSTDIAAAWEVVEEMRSKGWYPILESTLRLDLWDFTLAHAVRGAHSYEAKTAPLAICLAALKAVG